MCNDSSIILTQKCSLLYNNQRYFLFFTFLFYFFALHFSGFLFSHTQSYLVLIDIW